MRGTLAGVLTTTLWTAVSMAQSMSPASQEALRTEAEPAAAPYAVRERVSQPVSNGCRYLGAVQGKLEPQRDANDDGRGANRYAPMLVVSAEVACGGGVNGHVEPTRIDGPSLTQSQLESAIRDAARVNVESGGHVCSYVPNVRVEGTNVALPSVNESCQR